MTATRIAAARGPGLRCRGWRQEALLRMLENVLEVGERPEELIVYAALGKAARDLPSYRAIRQALLDLPEDRTLVLQSGRPVAVLPLGAGAPVVLSAVNNMVGTWQTAERFYELAEAGMTMWGGLTAGAWQYIGFQGVLQGAYELFRAVAAEHFGGSLSGRWILTSGLGGMGSAQPLAATMAGASSLTVEVDPAKLTAVLDRGALDLVVSDVDAGLDAVTGAAAPVAAGLLGNAAEVYPELVRRGVVPDVATDMTAAHDLRHGYVPPGSTVDSWRADRERDPVAVQEAAGAGIAAEVLALCALAARGAVVFESGNNLRAQAAGYGVAGAYAIPGFMQRYLRPLFCRAIGPFRWVALSGERSDLDVLDDLAASLFPRRPEVARWIGLARTAVPVQGLPARSCWLGHGERGRMAVAANEAVAAGRLRAPVLFTRDHLDAAGMTHPRIGTEGMPDGSDGISDWPILDALALSAVGADLVAVHGGGGGYSGWMHSAGMSVVADGRPGTAERLVRALDTDTGLGLVRYAEAGYPAAGSAARAAGLGWPLVPTSEEDASA